MNVIDFFNFIESKRPQYETGKTIVSVRTGGFSTPMNSDSTIEPTEYIMNGWFTNDKLNAVYLDAVQYNVNYIDNAPVEYKVVVNGDDINGKAFLGVLYDIYDEDTIIRRFKIIGKNGGEPFLYEKPTDDVDDFTHLQFQRDDGTGRRFFADFLTDVFFTLDKEDISWISKNLSVSGENINEAIENDDVEWLNEIIQQSYDESGGPYQLSQLYSYLTKLYGCVAQYEADEANYLFDGDCTTRHGNVKNVTVNWPYITLDIDIKNYNIVEDGVPLEPIYYSSVDLKTAQDILDERGVSFNIIRKYIETYPYKYN